jgi:hypothetical protein
MNKSFYAEEEYHPTALLIFRDLTQTSLTSYIFPFGPLIFYKNFSK